MTELLAHKLDELIAYVRSHPADFYRNAWGSADSFADLPTISRLDLIKTPLPHRQYSQDAGMAKIVRDEKGSFLSQWSFADIASEAYGEISARPMVCMADPHEAIEKSLWCYENGMLPLIGEKDADMAMYAAGKYRIDSLICDPVSLQAMHPYLSGCGGVASISVIGSSFSPSEFMPFAAYAKSFRLLLALPETGVIAQAEFSPSPKFLALPECVIERGASLVITKVARRAMPIIKYDTGIRSEALGA
jgi:hypothetical protein